MVELGSNNPRKTAEEYIKFVREKATRFPSQPELQRGVTRVGSFAVQGEMEGMPFDALNVYRYTNFLPDENDMHRLELFFAGIEQKGIGFDNIDGFSVFDRYGHEEFSGIQATEYAGRVLRCLQFLDSEGRLLPQLRPVSEEF